MKASELRIGNYHEYFVEDKVDERKEYWAVGQIDWQDIKILSEREERFANHPPPNPPKEYYRAIPLTEEWLLKFGFEKLDKDGPFFILATNYNFKISYDFEMVAWHNLMIHEFKPQHVHQLQNLYFALCGEELELK